VDYTPAQDIDPWDMQPGETDKSFAAFVAYRDLGPGRSVAKALPILGKKPNYTSTAQAWSRKFGWVMRADCWDAHQDRSNRAAILDESEKKARQKLAVADSMWKTAATGLILWSTYLNDQRKTQKELETKGSALTQPNISPSDVQRLADAGLKLSQLLEGKPTDIQEQRNQITVEDKRRAIQGLIGNPKLRSAMKKVAEAMEPEEEPLLLAAGGNGVGNRGVH
jgi:hypothetical protein